MNFAEKYLFNNAKRLYIGLLSLNKVNDGNDKTIKEIGEELIPFLVTPKNFIVSIVDFVVSQQVAYTSRDSKIGLWIA